MTSGPFRRNISNNDSDTTMSTISAWDDEYARISRAASQLRSNHSQGHPTARQQQVSSIQNGLQRLTHSLSVMTSSRVISSGDAQRRKSLVDNLQRQFGNPVPSGDLLDMSNGGGSASPQQRLSSTTQALRHQDQMIDELASGVGRLKDQTHMIHEEAGMHNRMLDQMDGDVENARLGLEAETLRAQKLKEDQSVWRLYMIIAGLSFLLFLLIMTGLG